MQFFSGFCLKDEHSLFQNYLKKSEYEVAGFSYGAIKAFEYALTTTKRVDTLTLLSPAFFQTKDKKFKRLQLLHYKKDPKSYSENFLKNIAYPSHHDMSEFYHDGNYEELEELLNYTWDKKKLLLLRQKNISVKVHLGEKDKIVDTQKAYDFFKDISTTYYYKNKGHILSNISIST